MGRSATAKKKHLYCGFMLMKAILSEKWVTNGYIYDKNVKQNTYIYVYIYIYTTLVEINI